MKSKQYQHPIKIWCDNIVIFFIMNKKLPKILNLVTTHSPHIIFADETATNEKNEVFGVESGGPTFGVPKPISDDMALLGLGFLS